MRQQQLANFKLSQAALTVLVAVALLVLVGMRYVQPQILSGMSGPDELVVGGMSALVLAACGLAWFLKMLGLAERREWSWWTVVPPALVALALAVCTALPTE